MFYVSYIYVTGRNSGIVKYSMHRVVVFIVYS